MTLNAIDTFCQALPGGGIRYPSDSSLASRTLCIGTRMFAWSLTNDAPLTVQVKATPELITSLIDNPDCMVPGYHMNKKHWIAIQVSDCADSMMCGLLEDTHTLVAASLPKVERLHLLGD